MAPTSASVNGRLAVPLAHLVGAMTALKVNTYRHAWLLGRRVSPTNGKTAILPVPGAPLPSGINTAGGSQTLYIRSRRLEAKMTERRSAKRNARNRCASIRLLDTGKRPSIAITIKSLWSRSSIASDESPFLGRWTGMRARGLGQLLYAGAFAPMKSGGTGSPEHADSYPRNNGTSYDPWRLRGSSQVSGFPSRVTPASSLSVFH